MNEVNCKNCETPVECEEGVANVTCSYCCAIFGLSCDDEGSN